MSKYTELNDAVTAFITNQEEFTSSLTLSDDGVVLVLNKGDDDITTVTWTDEELESGKALEQFNGMAAAIATEL